MAGSYTTDVLAAWNKLQDLLNGNDSFELRVDSLDLPSLIAVAQYDLSPNISANEPFKQQMEAFSEILSNAATKEEADHNDTKNGNASNKTQTAQLLIAYSHKQSVELPQHTSEAWTKLKPVTEKIAFAGSDDMPESWVRGSMLIHSHSLCNGLRTVRFGVIETLVNLLKNRIVPVMPLRGSMASLSDFGPIFYVASALQANPDFKVHTGEVGARYVAPADVALRRSNIAPISLEGYEINGFFAGAPFPVAIACLAQFKADNLVMLAQVLTALEIEALLDNVNDLDSFLGAFSRGSGQAEVARNIRKLVRKSRLAQERPSQSPSDSNAYYKYTLRSSAQWIGPYLEDVHAARQQLQTELGSRFNGTLNSISQTDLRHGDNKIAAVVLSATEKIKLAMKMLGKIIFSQNSELLRSGPGRRIVADFIDQNLAFSPGATGAQADMSACMTELNVLSSPISSCIPPNEMSYQSAASHALLSARYTHQVVEILSLMMSTQIICLCQALDYRAINAHFITQLEPEIEELTVSFFGLIIPNTGLERLIKSVWREILWRAIKSDKSCSLDHFRLIAQSAQHHCVEALLQVQQIAPLVMLDGRFDRLSHVASWTSNAAIISHNVFLECREQYTTKPDARPYIGGASARIYNFVRGDLQIPFDTDQNAAEGYARTNSSINTVHAAFESGALVKMVMDCFQEVASKEKRLPKPYYMKPKET